MGSIIVTAGFVALYVAFLVWYGGKGKPLSNAVVDALLVEMRKQAGRQMQGGGESPIFQQFRDLTENDDGREYYMVNLLHLYQLSY